MQDGYDDHEKDDARVEKHPSVAHGDLPQRATSLSEQVAEIERLRAKVAELNRRVQVAEAAAGPNAFSERGRRLSRYIYSRALRDEMERTDAAERRASDLNCQLLELRRGAESELLTALKAMEDTAMRLGLARGDGTDDDTFAAALTAHFAAIEQARAAIAKAEGNQVSDRERVEPTGVEAIARIEIIREDDGRFAADWTALQGKEGGMGQYAATPIGALAQLICTLLLVEEDRVNAGEPRLFTNAPASSERP